MALPAFVLAALLAAPAPAADCAAALRARVEAVRARSFPDLADKTLEDAFFDDPVDRAQARVRGAWKGDAKRVYVVRLNRSLCADAPPPAALDALLAHELSHLADYARRGAASLGRLALTYLLAPSGKSVASYERATDEAALRAGYGAGLRAYRVWLYARLSPEQAAVKRRLYLTPEEIDARLDAGAK